MRKITICIILSIIVCHISFAQKVIKLKHIKGSYIQSKDLTLAQTDEKAKEEAQKEALRKTGISESVIATDVSLMSENNKNLNQQFQSITSIELYGQVSIDSIVKTDHYIDTFGNIVSEVTINATVFKYDKPKDASFTIDINGIEKFYKNKSKLKFNLTPNKEGYLRIFLIDDHENCSQIYPNDYEKDKLLKSKEQIEFPIYKGIDYELETQKEIETNYLVFVYLKEDIAPVKIPNTTNLFTWLYSIMPDQRFVEYYNLQIAK